MPQYNKLVRDNIPEIIKATGKSFRTRILAPEEKKLMLQAKLQEELQEYLTASTDEAALEELADLLEVIDALAVVHGRTWQQLRQIQDAKRQHRGGFYQGIFLIDVDD
ncbi:nucleoside triphosphate pyrophosphohydrolase [Sulfobacillus thermosulfidooxidans]|uniref:nucleoside triphosphate pyrophosphohydrolase n=1 Tax=Sulfobacillus thermosulfidooxidans TaxID=28034 RepID=UPI00096BA620|nr:nucleoside triphosphate pyrophosphohydrolase [Sulfobacillus thermosulfidooxidans]OLZ10167.1 phosphoribosyl-ATP pyrophosphohydrolase [Sulfobacillus thermosulfidooxidans]OLZ16454.1 phosphoribosyl-ATP pyrophosphohydrolase [Sulfobacillus thermosulfidooxidans]OLZ19541.1 phosphoribosyl-ATP pyrophosphohydrolase [Sulfobacillus thermosulfidooxidans]